MYFKVKVNDYKSDFEINRKLYMWLSTDKSQTELGKIEHK